MSKPPTIDGYNDAYTQECERALVNLLHGFGPWKDSVYLVGGLTPRYLVKSRPPVVPRHAGTTDVDVVIDLQILASTEAYHTLAKNLERMGFERGENDKGVTVSWRWKRKSDTGQIIYVEFLADLGEDGRRVQSLPAEEKAVSAVNIPFSSIVADHHAITELQAELYDGGGVAVERVRHADIVAFTCLKAIAFDQRAERKDAHDLIYCLMHYEPQDGLHRLFQPALQGKHGEAVAKALEILRRKFASQDDLEGYRKDGPTAVALFEQGEGPASREQRIVRQRECTLIIERLLAGL
jgi:hypothetical protein